MVMQGSLDLDFSGTVRLLIYLMVLICMYLFFYSNFSQFRFGEWVEVVIDDKLPTRNGNLIYLKAEDPNEFWSPLLEKAYAKLNGSYTALEWGQSIDASVDFTGGIPEIIDLSNQGIERERLVKNMVKAYENKAYMSCTLGVSLTHVNCSAKM